MTYESLGAEVGRLVETKQQAYSDAHVKTGHVLAVLFPNGVPVNKLEDALTITRIVDKLCRITNDPFSLDEDAWQDIAGYGLLGMARGRKRRFLSNVKDVDILPLEQHEVVY